MKMTDRAPRRTQGIQSVERALTILDTLIAAQKPLRLVDLSHEVQMVTPTILRSLVSLEKHGYVRRLQDGRYQLGVRALEMGERYKRSFDLGADVVPVLERLCEATNESASFNVREGSRRICLFKFESTRQVRAGFDVVAESDLHDGTSTSQALTMPIEDMQNNRFRAIFFTQGLNVEDLASLSTPIYRRAGELIGALTVICPISRFTPERQARLAETLHLYADELSLALGAQRFGKNNYSLMAAVTDAP